MIIVKVWGGIGNQLFQYVFGQYLSYRFNQEVYYDDNSFISTDKLRKPELYAVDAEMKYNNSCSFSKTRGVKNRILRLMFQMHPKHHFIAEGSTIPQNFKADHVYFFQGYWQDIKFYEWLQANVPSFIIRSQKWPIELAEIRNQIESSEDSVSIHVRRGDYFKPENVKAYGVCDAAYFEKGLELMAEKVSSAKLFVFSDDLQWVKDNLQMPEDAVHVPNYNVSQFSYIELMSLCKHHIISNSSFSWWGAVLNNHEKAVVITPEKWRLDKVVDMALESWVKLNIENK